MARARLFSPLGATAGMAVNLDDEATIGRERSHTVVIDDGLISKAHARIALDSETDGFVLEDLGSTNGTALDGVEVVGRERLDHLHVITFAGRHEFVFQDLARTTRRQGGVLADIPVRAKSGPAKPDTPITEPVDLAATHEPIGMPQALADRLAADADPGPGDEAAATGAVERTQAHTVMPAIPTGIGDVADLAPLAASGTPETPEAGTPAPETEAPAPEAPEAALAASFQSPSPAEPGTPAPFALEIELEAGMRRFPLVYGINQIGRSAKADIRLRSERVSRRHAVLKVGPKITLRDQGSSNHTFLEDVRIQAEIEIEPGDRLAFGSIEGRLIHVRPGADE